MKKLLAAVLILSGLLLATQSFAFWHGKAGGGGGCSNSLDFSQACNSQYIR